MATNIGQIRARRFDFRTQANADWYDGIPIVKAGNGGVEAGPSNAGNGALALNGLDPDTPFGAHILTITKLDAGLARYTVEGPSGLVTGAGVSGLPVYVGGLTLQLAQGSTPFAVGDAFAVSVLPAPVDISGLILTLQARTSTQSANVALSGTSDTSDPSVLQTITNGGANGVAGMAFDRDSAAWRAFVPSVNPYAYDLLATDPETGRVEVAAFGTITHDFGVTHLP